MKTRRPNIAYTVLLCVAALAHAGSQAHAQAYPQTDKTRQVDALFTEWDHPHTPGAALGIIKNDRIIYARGYGMANLEYAIPNSPQTVFRIGSTSKHFTAMAVALLIEQGKVDLDDDIRQYFPAMPRYQAPITVRHLLHHTSGLRNYEHLMMLAGVDSPLHPSPYYSDEQALNMIVRQQALTFTPGQQYEYSNTNYFLLAEIVGLASGMETTEFTKQHMFDALGMHDTHFHNDVDHIVPNRASGYSPDDDGDGYRINMTRLGQIGTGSIFTTIEDFFKWDQNFYDNKLGKGRQDLIAMVETPGRSNDGESVNYGFGLDIGDFYGIPAISHSGSFVGFRSYYIRFPTHRFSVILLANQGPFPSGQLAEKIAAIYLDEYMTEAFVGEAEETDPVTEQTDYQIDLAQLAEYAGTFFSPELDARYVIAASDDSLTIKVGNYYIGELTATAPDQFSWEFGDIEFSRSAVGEVEGFLLHSDPIYDLRFSRVATH